MWLTNHPIKITSIKHVPKPTYESKVSPSSPFSIFLRLVLLNSLFSIGPQQQRDPSLHPRVKETVFPESWWILEHSRSVYSYERPIMDVACQTWGMFDRALWTFCPALRHLSFRTVILHIVNVASDHFWQPDPKPENCNSSFIFKLVDFHVVLLA